MFPNVTNILLPHYMYNTTQTTTFQLIITDNIFEKVLQLLARSAITFNLSSAVLSSTDE